MYQNPYKIIVFGSVVLGAVFGAGVLVAAFSGAFSVSARPPHWGITYDVLHGVFKASVRRAAQDAPEPPELDDPGLITLGAQHYNQVCASCHGGPDLGQSPIALSMRPRPQHLPAVVGQFEDKELYEILRNGVRMSAMPSWPADANFNEIWSVVAFLRQLPEMTAEEYVQLTQVDTNLPPSTDRAAMAWQHRGTQQALTLHAMAPPLEEYLYAAPSTGWRPIGMQDTPLAYCSTCHGTDGTGAVTGGHVPNLTLHTEAFLAQRLRDYANGNQPSGIMATVATSLSDPQIDALAAHYANLPTQSRPDAGSDANNTVGRTIVVSGLPDAGLPACASCHSAQGRTAQPRIPAIAGQNRAFLTARLTSFQKEVGTKGSVWNPMHNFASALSNDQIEGVAAYLSALPGDDPLTPAPLQTDKARAEDLVTRVCATCHSADLSGDAAAKVPNLTLQTPDYIAWQLQLFRTQQRSSAPMRQTAQRLDNADIDALAAFIGQSAPVAAASLDWEVVSAAALSNAKRLATEGDQERSLPACASCHMAASGEVTVIPELAGQYPEYIEHRLATFANFAEEDWLGSTPMRRIASALTAEERRALAQYFGMMPMRTKP